jgi:hypothetical protein
VGQPTSGCIIYTSPTTFIDGSVLRVPHTRIQDAKGQNLEMNPRPVDLTVERPLGATGDRQAEAAVGGLLARPPATARPQSREWTATEEGRIVSPSSRADADASIRPADMPGPRERHERLIPIDVLQAAFWAVPATGM